MIIVHITYFLNAVINYPIKKSNLKVGGFNLVHNWRRVAVQHGRVGMITGMRGSQSYSFLSQNGEFGQEVGLGYLTSIPTLQFTYFLRRCITYKSFPNLPKQHHQLGTEYFPSWDCVKHFTFKPWQHLESNSLHKKWLAAKNINEVLLLKGRYPSPTTERRKPGTIPGRTIATLHGSFCLGNHAFH